MKRLSNFAAQTRGHREHDVERFLAHTRIIGPLNLKPVEDQSVGGWHEHSRPFRKLLMQLSKVRVLSLLKGFSYSQQKQALQTHLYDQPNRHPVGPRTQPFTGFHRLSQAFTTSRPHPPTGGTT
jgi:hypothetical protein